MTRVRTGLDRIAAGDREAVRLVQGRNVGLLAHPASVDAELRHACGVVAEAGGLLRALFGPEHGWGGEAQDMEAVAVAEGGEESGNAQRAQVPVYSLYGQREADLSPTPEQLDGLDALVVDLQDVGSRYYTFVWTAALVLRAAAAHGIETVLLDRPNPLGGEIVEGRPQRRGYRSFVGLYDVPVRHALTIGELLEHVRREEGLDGEALRIVDMQGWARHMEWEDTGLPWVLPSPNMPTPDTAHVYPGGCVIEGTRLSEGRGTTRPFEIWGAPFLDGSRLARTMDIEGAKLRPLTFRPMFQKHAGTTCGGVQVHVFDPGRFRPYEAYLRLVEAARRQAPERFAWRTEPYEMVADRPAVDLLTGGPEYREAVDAGAPLDEVLEAERRGAERFVRDRRTLLRYR